MSSIDWTKWSVAEIREELVRLTGDNIEVFEAIKGKSILVERLIETRQRLGLEDKAEVSADFGAVEVEHKGLISNNDEEDDEDEDAPSEEEVVAPSMGSPQWEDYVLNHLTADEYATKDGKKFPKAAGLRRVTQIICGPIVNSGPIREHITPSYVSVVYGVSIMWTKGIKSRDYMSEAELEAMKIPVRNFSEIADCTKENTPHPYNLHAAATASTKAAGRVFKSILQLKCHTAEEMSMVTESEPGEAKTIEMTISDMESDSISNVQRITINTLASRIGVDVVKTLQFHGMNTDVTALTKAEAKAFIIILNKYQTDTEASMEIPDLIKS